MLNFAVCDKSKDDRKKIVSFLEKFYASRNTPIKVYEYTKSQNVVFDYQDKYAAYDILFLDVGVTDQNEMEIVKKIRWYKPSAKIALTIGGDRLDKKYSNGDGLYYLKKPYECEDIKKVLNQFMSEINTERNTSLLVKFRNNQTRIPYADILFIESRNTSLYVHTTTEEVFRIYGKLIDVAEELKDRGFVRCHQSYIVNYKFVKQVRREFELIDGTIIPIRRQDIKNVRATYYQYIEQIG